MPIREETGQYIARHGQGYTRFENFSHGIAAELLQFVALDDAIKISRLTIRNGTIARLEIVQHAAQPALSGPAPWPMRTQVLLAYRGAAPVRFPVDLRGTATQVPEARGRPAPWWIFPNAGDYGYFLSLLDTASVTALEQGALREVHDGLLRSMLWGALWDQVRDARLDPARFARLHGHVPADRLRAFRHDDERVGELRRFPLEVVRNFAEVVRDLRDQDRVGLPRDPARERDPARVATHHLDHDQPTVRLGRGMQPIQAFRRERDGAVHAEGHQRGFEVVVDRLGHAHHP